MPILGERRRGTELGHKDDRTRYIWKPCVDCGIGRWVRIDRQGFRCKHCAGKITTNGHGFIGLKGKDSINWKNGRTKGNGYVKIWYEPNGFFAPMRNGNYILEHRLVMAQHLGRLLLSSEIVHHRNGIKDDNRLENLQLCDNPVGHSRVIIEENKQLRERIIELEQRVKQLEEAEL